MPRLNRGSRTPVTVAHFDKIADRYGSLYDERAPVGYTFSIRRKRVLELMGTGAGRVLDVGCGPGVMASALVERGFEFWGVDPAVRMIESAKASLGDTPGVHLSVGAAEHLEFDDETFDAVICMGVLERISDDRAAVAEMIRVLKPGGFVIITVPNKMSPVLWWRDTVFYSVVGLLRPLYSSIAKRAVEDVVRGHRRYARRTFTAMIQQLGCTVTAVDYFVYGFLPAPADDLVPAISTECMRRTEGLSRTRLRGLAAGFAVKATKLPLT